MKTLTNNERYANGGTPGAFQKMKEGIMDSIADLDIHNIYNGKEIETMTEQFLNRLSPSCFSTWNSGNFRSLSKEGKEEREHFLTAVEDVQENTTMDIEIDKARIAKAAEKERQDAIFTAKVDCFQYGVAAGCILTGAVSYLWFIA